MLGSKITVLQCPFCPRRRGRVVVDLDALLEVDGGPECVTIDDYPCPWVAFDPEGDGGPCHHQVDALVRMEWESPATAGRSRRGGAVEAGWWYPTALDAGWERGEPRPGRRVLVINGRWYPTDPLVRLAGADFRGVFWGPPGRIAWVQTADPAVEPPARPGDEAGRWRVIADAVYAAAPGRLVEDLLAVTPGGFPVGGRRLDSARRL